MKSVFLNSRSFSFRSLLYLVTSALFVSCAAVAPTDPLVPAPGKALVIFYANTPTMYVLTVNGTELGHIGEGSYFTYQASPGSNSIKAHRGFVSREKQLNLETGKTYYVDCEEKHQFMSWQPELIVADSTEGAQAIAKLRRITPQ